jgi:hypothetical protein
LILRSAISCSDIIGTRPHDRRLSASRTEDERGHVQRPRFALFGGGTRTDAGGLLLFGWSRNGGDLRVPHFFATHIMQALPLLALTLDRIRPDRARVGIWIGALLSIALVGATFVQAASGRPFI